MIDIETARMLALAMPEAVEHDHFGRPSFRVAGKIFATLWLDERQLVIKLTPTDQMAATALMPDGVAPVPGAWGERGWTTLSLDCLERGLVEDALATAWRTVAPRRLLQRIPPPA